MRRDSHSVRIEERSRARLEYIIVGLVVLAWIIFDLARE